MKVARVVWYNEEECENLILETYEDVLEYQQHLADNTSLTFHKVVLAKIPLDRWDHYGQEGQYGNSFNLAVQKCKVFGGRPILEFDKITNQKCVSILDQIHKGRRVLINKVGGWCPVISDIHKILEITEYSPTSDRQVVIKANTRYINLENDPRLEDRAISYLESVDEDYSYVLRLCEFSKEELVRIFSDFKEQGGEVVYVYTTGSDVAQMWEYSEAVVQSGIRYVEFEFNSGYTDEHKAVVEYLRDGGVEVTLITM